jgi:hypothetical protein
VRAGVPHSANGTIVGKTFQAAGEYTRVRSGPRREFWSTEKIALPESYVFEIRLADATQVWYNLNSAAAAEFDVGQKVKLRLEERGIPLVWKRVFVREMAPAGR